LYQGIKGEKRLGQEHTVDDHRATLERVAAACGVKAEPKRAWKEKAALACHGIVEKANRFLEQAVEVVSHKVYRNQS
jgi:hypothetical protein